LAIFLIFDLAMNPERPFQPYGPAHLTVIFLTIALPFALAAIARRARSSRVERAIIATLSALLVLNYGVYLILVRNVSVMSWQQMLPLQLCDWGMVVVIWRCGAEISAGLRSHIFGESAARCKQCSRQIWPSAFRTFASSAFSFRTPASSSA